MTLNREEVLEKDSGNAFQGREWLLSDFNDDEWRLRHLVPGNSPSYLTVTWHNQRTADLPSERVRWTVWKTYGKRLVDEIYESAESRVSRTSSLAVVAREVRALCEYFCFEHALSSIEEVDIAHIREYEKYLAGLNISESYVDFKLSVLSYTWQFREEVGVGLNRRPFAFRERASIARRIGRKNGHTPTIRPREFFSILNEAIQLVENANQTIQDVHQYLALKQDHGRSVGRAFFRATGRSSRELFIAARATYGAALVVLFAFTAERKHEHAAILHEDAVSALEQRADLVGRESKGAGTATGRPTERPIIDVARRAIDVISQLTSTTRESSERLELLLRLPFQHSCSGEDEPVFVLHTTTLYNLLDSFGEFCEIERTLRPHMFRRAFALLWAWRFEIGDLYYLSKILLHNSFEFTRAYAEDEKAWEFMPGAMKELTSEILDAAFLGMRHISGGISSALRRYARVLHARVSIGDSSSIGLLVERLIDGQGLRVIPNPDGYCFMSKSRGRYAKCSLDGVMPNYANRSSSMCAGCPNFGVDETRVPVWKARLEMHQRVVDTTQFPALKKASLEGVRMCKRVLKLISEGSGRGKE